MNKNYKHIGKRKNSRVKAYIKSGSGLILINNKNFSEYFQSIKYNIENIKEIIELANLKQELDIFFFAQGGGLHGQLQACILALSKTLVANNINLLPLFKKHKLLTQDSRIKERRKYGLKKARKASQYSKR